MKLRTKHIKGLGYFPQVKHKWYSRWKTLKPWKPFELLASNNVAYPCMSSSLAEVILTTYKRMYDIDHGKATYLELIVND